MQHPGIAVAKECHFRWWNQEQTSENHINYRKCPNANRIRKTLQCKCMPQPENMWIIVPDRIIVDTKLLLRTIFNRRHGNIMFSEHEVWLTFLHCYLSNWQLWMKMFTYTTQLVLYMYSIIHAIICNRCLSFAFRCIYTQKPTNQSQPITIVGPCNESF